MQFGLAANEYSVSIIVLRGVEYRTKQVTMPRKVDRNLLIKSTPQNAAYPRQSDALLACRVRVHEGDLSSQHLDNAS